jgi:hypothetical protein
LSAKKIEVEDLFSESDLSLLDGGSGTINRKRKKLLYSKVQEFLTQKRAVKFSKDSTEKFQKLIDFLGKALREAS